MAQCNTLWRSLGKTAFKWWPGFVKQGALVMNCQPTTWHDGRPAIEFKPGRTLGKVERSVAKRDEWWPVNHGGIKQWVRRSDKCAHLCTMDDGRYRVRAHRQGLADPERPSFRSKASMPATAPCSLPETTWRMMTGRASNRKYGPKIGAPTTITPLSTGTTTRRMNSLLSVHSHRHHRHQGRWYPHNQCKQPRPLRHQPWRRITN